MPAWPSRHQDVAFFGCRKRDLLFVGLCGLRRIAPLAVHPNANAKDLWHPLGGERDVRGSGAHNLNAPVIASWFAGSSGNALHSSAAAPCILVTRCPILPDL